MIGSPWSRKDRLSHFGRRIKAKDLLMFTKCISQSALSIPTTQRKQLISKKPSNKSIKASQPFCFVSVIFQAIGTV